MFDDVEIEHFAPEEFTLVDRDPYLNVTNGIGQAKPASAIDKASSTMSPPISSTTRNWNTVLDLVPLS